jgi:di/tricarboxylate transporter
MDGFLSRRPVLERRTERNHISVYVILSALVLLFFFLPRPAIASGESGPGAVVDQRVAQAETAEKANTKTGTGQVEGERPRTSGMTTSIVFMLAFVAGIVILFLWEPVPLYVIALLIPFLLVVFQHMSGISVEQALSGFSSEATITILAMFILSQGIQNTGLIQILGDKISSFTGSSETKQLGVITALSGPTAGIINNTPVVAIFIPMVSNMARRLKTSPSKLMIPLSYASMMGGTLTLIGSSTNLLASDLSDDLLNHPIGFFEFTAVGMVILITGSLYLVFVSGWLLPARIDPEKDLAEEYEMGNLLTELVLTDESALVGQNVGESFDMLDVDLDLVQIIRDEEKFMEPLQVKTLRAGDRLIVRTGRAHLMELLNMQGIRLWTQDRVTEEQLEAPIKGQTMIETVIPAGSFLEGQNLKDVNFVERYDATVLAVRRGEELTHTRMDELTIRAGDVLLLMATETTLNRLRDNNNFIVAEEIREEQYEQSRIPLALGIFVAVIVAAATGIVPISMSALGGGLLMCLTGCVEANELHESVDWEVIFLLAGLIPLGTAMEQTGAARYLATQALPVASELSALGALVLFYLLTVVMTNLIHKNASIVLMIPIAVDAATRMNLEAFPFLITVMLAASTAFLTPVGNHTNLMVYGPGGYRFTDFLKVGAPMQILLAIVTPITVWLLWL